VDQCCNSGDQEQLRKVSRRNREEAGKERHAGIVPCCWCSLPEFEGCREVPLVVESGWSVFIVSTGVCFFGVKDWLHLWVCMGVPGLDGCVLKFFLHVLACRDIITS
jgi:hypothetical protein